MLWLIPVLATYFSFLVGVNGLELISNPDYIADASASVQRAQSKYARYVVSAFHNNDKAAPNVNNSNNKGAIQLMESGYDLEYYGTVSVGTPSQELKLNFDTGSSDLWFACVRCLACGAFRTKYNPLVSTSYSDSLAKWRLVYGDGSSASGHIGFDNVNLGGFKIRQQTLQLATQRSQIFDECATDGVLGLGFDSLATVPNVITPMNNLIQQHRIKEPIFSVFYGKASEGGGGELLFGDYNPNHIAGNLTTVPIDNSQGFWGVTIETLGSGNHTFGTNMYGIVDTGTTLLIFPDDVAYSLANKYNATDNGDGTFKITCDKSQLEPLVFTMAGTEFVVPPDSLIYVEQDQSCTAGFAYAGMPFSILGGAFIKNHYIIFNVQVPNIQMAPSKRA
ncbi:aspartic proteinase IV [Phascolomyces articulosus]|uniref:Mucorpepsin n=1 Tax=Phascolomyces articulosus TaxID=60185 RepID=A0AAD5PDR1_9FUNG|nr:aspartic proteinase IV [Phascolomyces articulosus]